MARFARSLRPGDRPRPTTDNIPSDPGSVKDRTHLVRYDGESTSVRIVDIDAPEQRDPAWPAATKALARLIEG